jgi:MinD-like ATPase involved in chromosome partitioning or flagellar assembly
MARIALALPLQHEDRLSADVVHHGHELVARCASADELAASISTGRTELAVVGGSPRYLNGRLLAEADSAGVRMLALVSGEADRKHAAALGLHETAPDDSEWAEVEARLLSGVPARPEPRPASSGRVLTVWGPAGAPGRTTMAISIAAELAAAGKSVVLADVDTYSGSIAPALGLLDEAPGFAAACRLAAASSLTLSELERIGERYSSANGGFWVLTGIGRPSRWPELSADRVTEVIARCREWADYTVLDTSASLENDEEISSDLFAPRRNAATITALRQADEVLAVGSADPVGLSRFLRAHVDLVETLESDRLTVVMNRIRSGAIGLSPAAQVRQSLQRFGGIEDPMLIPHDQAAFDAAVLSGRTILDVAPKSPARQAIRQMVAERVLRQPATNGRRRR